MQSPSVRPLANIDALLNASREMELAGGIVPALALLEAVIKRDAVLPMDIVRVRVRLAELYDAYTLNSDLSKEHLVHALQAIQQHRGPSKRTSAIRVQLYLKLAENQMSSGGTFAATMKDLDSAFKAAEEAKLHDILPRVHLARFDTLVAYGQDKEAYEALAKAQQSALANSTTNPHTGNTNLASQTPANRPADTETLQPSCAFSPMLALTYLLGAHLHLRSGLHGRAVESLKAAKAELLKSKGCPQELQATHFRDVSHLLDADAHKRYQDVQMEEAVVKEASGKTSMLLSPLNVATSASAPLSGISEEFTDSSVEEMHAHELSEYYMFLCALSAVLAGDFALLAVTLESLNRIASALWGRGVQGTGRGERQNSLLRWTSGAVCEGIVCIISSLRMIKGHASTGQNGEEQSAMQMAEAALVKGIEAVRQEVGEAQDKTMRKVFPDGSGPVAFTFGYVDQKARRLVEVMMHQRIAELQLAQANYVVAVVSIGNMKKALDGSNLKMAGASEGIKTECAAALHCVLAQYCGRVGLVDVALQHLQRAEMRTTSVGTRILSKLLRAILLVDSPEAAEQSAREVLEIADTVQDMVNANKGDVGITQQLMLQYLKSHVVLSRWANDMDKVQDVLETLEGITKVAHDAASDVQLQIRIAVLKASALYHLGDYGSSIQCLGEAHAKVCSLGDIWLELKVLRGLERGYLKVPDKQKVAKASLTIKANREHRISTAIAEAKQHSFHRPAIQWDLGST